MNITNKDCTVNIYIQAPQDGKRCSKCRLFKPPNEYHKRSDSYDGITAECKMCRKEEMKVYYNSNKEQIRAYHDGYKSRRNELRRARRKQDEEYRNKLNIRSRILSALKSQNSSKCTKTIELVRCSKNWLKFWLDYTKNYYAPTSNNTHLDHHQPCSSIDFKEPEEQLECFNWRNLRIIDAKENIVTNARFPTEEELITQQKLIYSFRKWMRSNNPTITYLKLTLLKFKPLT